MKVYQRLRRYNAAMEKDIRSYSLNQIRDICQTLGQPRFRAEQLIQWLYVKGAQSYDEMTNLPRALRATLAEECPLRPLEIVDKQVSSDGTRKYVIGLTDGCYVETVGIPACDSGGSLKRLTVCFSTQVGCAMQCAFCATGHEGFTRNLSSGEIISQVLVVQNDFDMRVSNLVSMGQGEPFQNYDALLEALRFINNKKGLGIGARHITLSTCGLIKSINKLAEEPEQFTLAVSLHAARQEVRDHLMPRCAHNPLPELKQALQHYVEKTGRRVSFEYLLIRDVNDTEKDLEALLAFTDSLLCHINLIPLNDIEDSPFKPSLPAVQNHWLKSLQAHHHEATIRNSKGADIDGACGQLKNKLTR